MNDFDDKNTDELTDNFIAVLNIVKESLDEADQMRLVQALISRPEADTVENLAKITP